MKNDSAKAPQDKKTENHGQEPLAPFNQTSPFELAALAILLSKGKESEKYLHKAASLWAASHNYYDRLQELYWGDDLRRKVPQAFPKSHCLGSLDEFMDLKTACARYSWGKKHLRELLKQTLSPAEFKYIWKLHIKDILLPKTILDYLAASQAQKRSVRSQPKLSSPTQGV